jgi:cytochrome c553
MKRVAVRLSDADITAVAGWLSQQVAMADSAPESAAIERMPYACGSQNLDTQHAGDAK